MFTYSIYIKKMPVQILWFLPLQFQLAVSLHPRWPQVMVQLLGSLSPKWETQVKFLAAGFSITQLWMPGVFRGVDQWVE